MERRDALSPRLGQYWTKLGKQISCVLSFFLSLFFYLCLCLVVIHSEGYEDVGALVVSCWEDEEGDVSHLGNDAL